MRRIATLQELEEYWSLDDACLACDILDAQDEAVMPDGGKR